MGNIMTDKVQKIREEVERLRSFYQIKYQHLDTNDNMCLVECGKRNLCNELLLFIDSLQEEPVSDELDEEADKYSNNDYNYFDVLVTECDGTQHLMDDKVFIKDAFKAGSEWKEDFVLTWEDAKEIYCIALNLRNYVGSSMFGQPFYEEVLKRFKEMKEK